MKKKETKKPDGRGGARKGAGRKSSGKKYFSYFLDEKIGNAVSKQENPSQFVEEAIKERFELDKQNKRYKEKLPRIVFTTGK